MMLQNFGTALSREQMKLVKGGNRPLDIIADGGDNKCNVYCKTNSDCDASGGACTKCDEGAGSGGKTCGHA
jgi:hypothetical protein